MLETTDTTGTLFRYKAFISYNHEDEKFAAGLQRQLETFRLPRKLRKEFTDFPQKIYPIFRDKTDLLPKKLNEELFNNLLSSEYLIVICSPHSTNPDGYVNAEVQNFIAHRSAKKIIPVIIRGQVGSNDKESECFCPALLNEADITLGVDYQANKSSAAFIKIIATLTNKTPTDFINRWNRYQRRRRIIRDSILSISLVCAGIIGYWAWNYYVPKTHYYADYTTEWGVPVGIGELTEDQILSMYAHYEITTQKGHVQELIYANSASTPAAYMNDLWANRPQTANYYYRDDGEINYIEYLNSSGGVEYSQVYSTDLHYIDFQLNKNNSSADTQIRQLAGTGEKSLDPNVGSVIDINSDITRYCLTYNTKGQITQVLYQRDNRGTASTDAYGISGIQYELDEYGRIITQWFLNRRGEIMYDATGVAGQRFVYTGPGIPEKVINLSLAGSNKNSTKGWAITTRTFDSYGNITYTQYFDMYNEPTYCVSGQEVFSKLMKTYNKKGFISNESYCDIYGNLMNLYSGFSTRQFAYSENGQKNEIRYYDAEGNAVLNTSGYHIVRINSSDDGLTKYTRYYDIDDLPVNQVGGFSLYIETYDTSGNIQTKEYYDKDRIPVIISEGMHKRVFEYDALGRIAYISVYGIEDEPIVLPNNIYSGVHKMSFQYDDNGNVAIMKTYGVNDEPCLIENGYFEVQTMFSNAGNLLEESYWGIDGAPAISQNTGYHKKTFKYDDYGNTIEIAVFGTDGSPSVWPNSEVWKSLFTYDENNYVKSTSNYGIDGNPVYTPSYGRWFRVEYVRDDKGNDIEEIYYDIDGNLGYCLDGYARARYEYNEEGTAFTKSSYYDTNGNLVISTDGYAYATFEHDDYGNVSRKCCYGTDGKLIMSNDDFAIVVTEHDYMNRLVLMEFYDMDEKPMLTDDKYFRVTLDYLDDGSEEIRTYLTDEAYAAGRYGTYYLYNSSDELVKKKSIDADGSFIETKNGLFSTMD